MHHESLEMAQVASLVMALAPGPSVKEIQVEIVALIDATRSINWVTTEEREVAQQYLARLERLLVEVTRGTKAQVQSQLDKRHPLSCDDLGYPSFSRA